ncbi:MAG: TonB-dependent receptor [Bacteroidales bacterium]|nr:TonB-dependent receptor [Bacteroidales bacterium]
MLSAVLVVMGLTLLNVYSASAQNTGGNTVSGTVFDQTGAPLPGATVQIKGTSKGVMSDTGGKYSLNAKKGDVLLYSFMGMLPEEVTVGDAAIVNVTLKDDAELLEEAVSIGYGSQSRALLTNSITKVSASEFDHSPQQDVLAQLQGKVPGLSVQATSGQPGEISAMFIRGGTTTGVSSDTPLIIVDGVVSQGTRSIADINPADIESMEVLKDAASTAIYGARAANGIILVTTKQGQTGKVKVNFRYTLGVDQQPKRLDLLNAREYVYLTRKAINEDPRASQADKDKFLKGSFGMSTGNDFDSPNTLEFTDVFLAKYGQEFVADLLENKGWETMIDPVTGRSLIFMDTDFQDATYKTALKHEYNFDVSGGNDKATYYASLHHLNQDGIVRGTWYKNYSATFNGSYKVNRNLKFFSKANLNIGDRNTMSNAVNSLQRAILMPPTYRLYYENGMPAEGEGMSSFRPREYENYYKTKYTVNTQYRVGFQMGAEWQIIDGLKFAPTIYYTSSEGVTSSFEALNATTGTEIRPASAAHQYNGHIQADAILSYDKKIKKNHVSAVAGATYTTDNQFALSGSGSGASTDLIPTLNATADSTQRTSSTRTNEAMLSYFGRVNYDYDGKYMASVSLRADGSSRFSEGHKWGYFPGASAGWNIHKEGFFKNARKAMSKLKLRASYGQAGNNSLTLANTYGQYGITGTTYLGEVGIINSTLGNADLLWETTESYDLGLDLGFFNGRLEFAIDGYNKITYDRLYDNKLPSTTGYSSIKCNYGSMGTKGIEVEVNAVPVSTRNFSWNLGFNFTWYRTIILSQPENGELLNRTGGNYVYDPVTGEDVKVGGFAEGERFGGRWAFNAIGVYQTDEEAALAPYDEQAKGRKKYAGDTIWEDRNNDGYINAKDMVFMGWIRPDKLGGITNEFRYKGLTVRVIADFAMGHVINNGNLGYGLASIRNNFNTFGAALTDCWTPENPDAKYPRFTPMSDSDYGLRNFTRSGESIGASTSGQTNTSMFYHKGDYLALREISFSYNLPDKAVKAIHLKGLQVFGGVYNVGYLTAYDGMVPELYNGYDYGFYPRPREFSFGLNLSF